MSNFSDNVENMDGIGSHAGHRYIPYVHPFSKAFLPMDTNLCGGLATGYESCSNTMGFNESKMAHVLYL